MTREGQQLAVSVSVVVIIIVVAVLLARDNSRLDSAWYYDKAGWLASQHNVPEACITRLPRPIDCDWGTAPLGDKGCAYEKRVEFIPENLSKECPSAVLVKWQRR